MANKRSSYTTTVPESQKRVKHITGYNTVRLTEEDFNKNRPSAIQ